MILHSPLDKDDFGDLTKIIVIPDFCRMKGHKNEM